MGKGVTFDSGGISIKPSERMDDMKMDKTGACAVLHAIATASQLAPGIPLLAVAPAVENMPGPHSARPGDVVTALNGKAVEITNTDAEGRLILGDAMTWAERQGATHIVDVATLTGAVSRALGRSMTGGFGDRRPALGGHGRRGAPAGRAALAPARSSTTTAADMDSPYADIVNSGSAEGSLVKSALFLREFVTKPWVHLDIAGTAYLHKDATVDGARRDRRDARVARGALPRRLERADVHARRGGSGPSAGRGRLQGRAQGRSDRHDARAR